MTDYAELPTLSHLRPAETRVAVSLSHPRWIAIACVALLAALGWACLALMAADTGWVAALCRAATAGEWQDLLLSTPMWAAMTLAMMLPTAGPMILTYSEIADTAARKREPAVSPLVLVAGYVTVWLGFSLAAALLQSLLHRAGLFDGVQVGLLLSGALFVAAGLYQFSPLKAACLAHCQRPFPFFFANWTVKPRGVFELGVRQGLYCLGCCWAMMLLMFAVGTMNVVWMAVFGMIMAIEKLTATARFSRIVGAVLVLAGVALGLSEGM